MFVCVDQILLLLEGSDHSAVEPRLVLWSTFKNPFVNVYVSQNAHNVNVPQITHAASVATLKALFKQGQGNKRVQCEWDV